MKIIDLSLPIDDTLLETHAAKIDRISHQEGVEHFNWVVMSKQPQGQEKFDKGERVAKSSEIPDGEMLSLEIVNASVHMGTHVDAPFHYGSKCEGKPAKQIMDVPLEWCYGNGVRLDFTHLKYPDVIDKKQVEEALKKINYKIKPMDIVLIWTNGDKLLGTDDYVNKYVGMMPDAVEYILDQGVKMMGIDTIGLDRPCFNMFKEFLSTKDKSKIWPSHFLGRRREYCHMERMGNLGAIPKDYGFTVSCFPVKVRNAGAGWTRVVAMVE
ncbi:MAG TPA: cyclase family protein [Candidatus Omnitrophota bacterium]|nr:cyclase family protein [Candidatus Omnitrophota bacterium]HPD85519.1 cyclase family protein [Candidatus Omnitrophota bacterium]HRZ04441.1 cyclase family protein [Candidatus Omnitrophota bacterium]